MGVRRPLPLQFPRGSAEQFSIGRDASCDLAIADMTVSRRHATLERTEDGWLLTDLESTNGTRVNGWRVRGKVSVTPGDLVSFGNSEYSCVSPGGPTPQPPAYGVPPPYPAGSAAEGAAPPCPARVSLVVAVAGTARTRRPRGG